MNAALEAHDITMRFGGNVAVDAVSLSAEAGRVTGLIGPNGAGKTTLFNTICGLLTPTSGAVYLSGTNVTKLKPFKRARQGLARTFQRLELWSLLTVRENVTVAAELRARYGKDGNDPRTEVEAIIDSVGLSSKIDARVDELPTGQARLVEIARALATKPSVLLLDEPASGLDDRETDQLGTLLRTLASQGMAVLLVEHDVELVMQVCDFIYVLDFGRIIATGTADQVRRDEAVLAAYLGGNVSTT
ncbi:MAG TPA: ABC transporter ATP-binding protein [Acidimicrobiia bacterium]